MSLAQQGLLALPELRLFALVIVALTLPVISQEMRMRWYDRVPISLLAAGRILKSSATRHSRRDAINLHSLKPSTKEAYCHAQSFRP